MGEGNRVIGIFKKRNVRGTDPPEKEPIANFGYPGKSC